MTPLDAKWMRDHPLPRPGDGGKESRGAVLVVGGRLDLIGAVLLAGVAALRAGAGKLQLAADPDAVAPLSIAVPEARVLSLGPADPGGGRTPATDNLRKHAAHCDALLIGPGMLDDKAGLARALVNLDGAQPLVLDAGALQGLSRDLAPAQGRPLVLTPHAGEMANLLERDRSAIEDDPLAAAVEASEIFGATVVMKGASTHVVTPRAPPLLYAGGGPGLGASGSGDVLAGLITGLLARGAPPAQAAGWGVFLHGEAGARLASRLGPVGFLAREISAEAPAILAAF